MQKSPQATSNLHTSHSPVSLFLLLSILSMTLLAGCGSEKVSSATVATPQVTDGTEVNIPPTVPSPIEPIYNIFLHYAVQFTLTDMPQIIFSSQSDLNKLFQTADEGMQDMNVLAHCTPVGNVIYITDPRVTGMDRIQFEMILLHEIGHCVLHRVHRFDTAWDDAANNGAGMQVPLSLMFPVQILSLTYYTAHRDDYLRELVGGNDNGPIPAGVVSINIIEVHPAGVLILK